VIPFQGQEVKGQGHIKPRHEAYTTDEPTFLILNIKVMTSTYRTPGGWTTLCLKKPDFYY